MGGVSKLPLLPQEILVEIFSKLPAKSLVQFSAENNQGKLQANRIQFLDGYDARLGTSSDGLICLSGYNGDVAICNISTKQCVSLPRIQSVTPSTMSAQLCYESFAKRYKVWMSAKKFAGQYKHFTLGVNKSWREINCSFSFLPIYSHTSVHIDGVIYSINFPGIEGLDIVAFDIRVGSFSMIPFPDELSTALGNKSSSQYYLQSGFLRRSGLVVVDGRLAIVQIGISDIGLSYMDVWTWEKSMEWEKLTIPIALEESRIIREVHVFRITSTPAGEIVLLLGIIRECLTMLVCNLKRQVWRKFGIGGVEDFPVNLALEC